MRFDYINCVSIRLNESNQIEQDLSSILSVDFFWIEMKQFQSENPIKFFLMGQV